MSTLLAIFMFGCLCVFFYGIIGGTVARADRGMKKMDDWLKEPTAREKREGK